MKSHFHSKIDCFYCATEVGFEAYDKRKKPKDVFKVTTVETKDMVLDVCSNRGDNWAQAVWARLLQVHDFPAADAVYQQSCSSNFSTVKQTTFAYCYDKNARKKGKNLDGPQVHIDTTCTLLQ